MEANLYDELIIDFFNTHPINEIDDLYNIVLEHFLSSINQLIELLGKYAESAAEKQEIFEFSKVYYEKIKVQLSNHLDRLEVYLTKETFSIPPELKLPEYSLEEEHKKKTEKDVAKIQEQNKALEEDIASLNADYVVLTKELKEAQAAKKVLTKALAVAVKKVECYTELSNVLTEHAKIDSLSK